ncbi:MULTISPECIES: 1,3-beta-galactosyl-N-acetylhexosamine phosphorylase [unclassified Breznakia]|uniref:1,3-beta-galactosyl-N-acetylhexosamine phosphorylase n=1 Tax=unclassified Breznakia TaxID=2623764 RepID=UPI002474DE88|nr:MULTISPECIES: 1,3-beta-galactosyl-N-acetylhexosamine phosphorylase [unclassified Breznakia]MDH6367617.1 1,3-beta-galactosyl-N-acetylhexosamine phosphorylase [Breznakia sp. PH1-1]MDH6403967.1 1,3-beta-galactosyl-N-acetylhexosamine phosphorylase [Breznakia sp. PF1-11]MDH6411676.1 1,3-beta-galactosyl-N-acetylhexosamine phosphorylase [Breznakia sp. PFB1-11]MDH6414746.1 1,3-beta-galactosyl-N-acetylhexosamine phosphorylase [Breznakia sp. PFB1-14]MDH6416027.1 1,3-beta-galactosyl-N-acetylhexosamine
MSKQKGRLTVPTDIDMIGETVRIIDYWGGDAIRDCDGTVMPDELKSLDVKKYATYYTTRKDNDWARKNPDEIQQVYIMSQFESASSDELRISIMKYIYKDLLQPNTNDDMSKWWEVIDRTTGEIVAFEDWTYDETTQEVVITKAIPFHAYTVSFLAYIIWDPVHMYNAITNDWKDEEHQMTYDVRQPKTQAYVIDKFKRYLKDNPEIDVIRFTTFFHQFTLIFDEQARESFVEWFGYNASVSPYILGKFEAWAGYPFRPEYIINKGTYNSQFVIPTKEFKDFIEFQQIEVSKLMKVFVDATHEAGKEAMMFLGDHWIGTEPYGKYFKEVGLDAVVGSVGNGSTLRIISDIPGVKYTEGRLLPYFFPDTFHEGGDPLHEAKVNWVTARRAILRKPVDRIGYGGYLKLALEFPEFIDYVKEVADEFRELYDKVNQVQPYCVPFKVYVLNSYGKLRSWGAHMVHHAIPYEDNYGYEGYLEALSGLPVDIEFISFDELLERPDVLDTPGVILNVGDAYTSFSGGEYWKNEAIVTKIRQYIYQGNGFIGIGDPSAYQKEGHYFQLYDVLGVDKEVGFTLSHDKYNWDEHEHFITKGLPETLNFGNKVQFAYANRDTTVIKTTGKSVNLAVHNYGKGRAIYMSGLPFNFENTRLLYRSLFYAAGKEDQIEEWYADNYNVEVNMYPSTSSYCVVNNTYEKQEATVFTTNGQTHKVELEPTEIKWFTV